MKASVSILALAGVLAAGVALADARIQFRTTEGDGGSIQSMLIGHGKLRSDADAQTSILIDPAAGSFTILDHGKRQFSRMGRTEIEQISGALGDAMAQMQQAMANMPPELRAQMQGMAGGALGGLGKSVQVSDTGRTDTVAGHRCSIHQTRMQNQVINEVCLGNPNVLDGLSSADRRTLESALDMLKTLTESLSQGPLSGMVDLGSFHSGLIPLRVTDIERGRRSTSEFSGIDNSGLSADLFTVPAGYREQKIEMPRMGR